MAHRALLFSGFVCAMPVPAQEASLRELAQRNSRYIGAAVGGAFWDDEPVYREILKREFSMLVAENAMKFEPIEPSQGNFNWTKADALIDFAEENRMKVRGHTLVWHRESGWAEDLQATREEMIAVMQNHIRTVVGRYKGRISHWDVVNEAIDEGGDVLRDSFWRRKIGDDYIDIAFQTAHEADPDALLFYNDFGAENMGDKSDKVYNLAKGMLERGIPIHGVGMQCHFSNTGFQADEVDRNMKRLNDLGLMAAITELDFCVEMPADESDLEQQKQHYKRIMEVCLENTNCTSLLTWGFTDKYSWIPSHFEGKGAALPLDADYEPKPGYYGLREALNEQPVPVIVPETPHF